MPQLASQFIETLQRCRLLTAAQERALLACCEGSPAQGEPPATEKLVAQLLNDRWITPFQAEKLLAGRSRELTVGPYVLTDLIGMGGMGAVYAALDPDTRQPVAVKVLSADFKADAGMRTRFRLEARAGMEVHHPNLLRTLAHGTTDDVFGEMDYVVMELFRGIALHELVSVHGPLSWSMASDMISQAAAALQALHDQGLIHRDVKPDNLLVDETGLVKLIDYGLALTDDAVRDGKVLEGGEEFTLTMLFGHDCLGTPDYMAPEQAASSFAADARSDVYALGCTLYTMLAGKRPYMAPSKAQLIEAHRTQPVPSARVAAPSCPKALDAVIARMMAKAPAERFDSMDAVVLALAPYATRRPVRFKYEDLLKARRKLADQRSAIALARKSSARTTSSVRAAVLAAHMETGVGTETAVDGTTNSGIRKLPEMSAPVPAESAAQSAQAAFAAYQKEPDSTAPILARLVFTDGQEIAIRGMNFTIGRGRDNDLTLAVADLSTRHCSLTFDGDHWVLRDYDSRNGVRVNGQRIKERVLSLGDLITLATDFGTLSRRRPRVVVADGDSVAPRSRHTPCAVGARAVAHVGRWRVQLTGRHTECAYYKASVSTRASLRPTMPACRRDAPPTPQVRSPPTLLRRPHLPPPRRRPKTTTPPAARSASSRPRPAST
jgi:serine/threonine protein kinase